MNRIEVFTTIDSFDKQTMISALSDHYLLKSERPKLITQTFYDTFDWRLFNRGFYLVRESNRYILNSIRGEPVAEQRYAGEDDFSFWWELAPGVLQMQLRSYLDIRALRPVAKLTRRRQPLRILNQDQKTVLYVHLDEIRPKGSRKKETLGLIALQPVRGYVEEARQFKSFLTSLKIRRERGAAFLRIMSFLGKQVGDYTSKLNLKLSTHQSALQATRQILGYLLDIIQRNEAGVIEDIDTEFLHDYRVAIRRTRSALTQIKGVLPAADRSRWKAEFARLGKISNELRDLDVYLLERRRYEEMLPRDLRPGLAPMFRKVETARKRAHARVARHLQTPRYKKTLAAYRQFLDVLPELSVETKNANKSATGVARKLIVKKYRQIVASGEAITDASPDRALHDLRIECKKLRYLMEFFSSLFDTEGVTQFVKQLKKLQDNLGEFNDLCVQQESLREFLEKALGKARGGREVAALGGLISVLHHQQQTVKRKFSRTFERFSAPEQTEQFKQLFG